MTTPIRPSLAQMLNPQAATARPAAQPVRNDAQGGGFTSALAAQRAFFQQVTAPKVTPATYTTDQIAKATPQPVASAPSPAAAPPGRDDTQPLKRPGSYLNIVV